MRRFANGSTRPTSKLPRSRLRCSMTRSITWRPSETRSVGEFPEHRIHATPPRPMEQLELALGGRLVGFGVLDQRREEDALVGAVAVVAGAPLQARGGDRQRAPRQFAHEI